MANFYKGLPSVIKCGAYDIKVILTENLCHKGRGCHGLWDADIQTIKLCISMLSPTHQATIVLHELNHALYWFFEIGDDEPEEQVVACLSTGWVMLYRDNPELIKWLQKNTQ